MGDHVGSHGRYTHGCRCESCREAHSAYTRERRAAALAAGTLSHGRPSTYDAGCRCEKCYAAKQVRYYTAPNQYAPKSGQRRQPTPYDQRPSARAG